MLDAFYILVAALFFVGCWYFTKACERLSENDEFCTV